MYDIIIIGAGPAGLSASIYALRSNKKVLILEKNTYGGQIINASVVENYPSQKDISGYDLASKMYEQALSLGLTIKYEEVLSIKNNNDYKEVITKKDTYKTKSIIIATGTKNRKLGLENEDKFIGKGVSYCATCDGNFFKDKSVAVVGGGNSAIEDAIYLSSIASSVYLIHRSENFRAFDYLTSELKNKNNVKFILNSNIISINGSDNLESLTIKDKDNKISKLEVSGLFIAIGRIAENEIFKDIIKLDSNGYIVASENTHTNIDGIYVCGDNRTKQLRQLVTAVSDGATAATEAIKYVNK